jgi:hypothetical protein
MNKARIEILDKKVDDFIKDVNVVKIDYASILGGKEFYAYIFYEEIKEK